MRHVTISYPLRALVIALVAGGLYGAAAIGVFRAYSVLLALALVGVAGILRWDDRRRT